VPVTVFVVTGRVGGTNAWDGHPDPNVPTFPLMTWSDLEALAKAGARIAAHGRTHRVLAGLSPDALDEELLGSREDLRARIGQAPDHIAYPFGSVDAHVASCARRVFAWGHTTDFRAHGTGDDPMGQPRLDMYYFQRPGATARWGSASFRRRVAAVRVRRAIRAWMRAW
jgi:peptidoglycan/xylan/chitin deacetylase (PgdA/CDA1 family)